MSLRGSSYEMPASQSASYAMLRTLSSSGGRNKQCTIISYAQKQEHYYFFGRIESSERCGR
jgi:hypothetical protein